MAPRSSFLASISPILPRQPRHWFDKAYSMD